MPLHGLAQRFGTTPWDNSATGNKPNFRSGPLGGAKMPGNSAVSNLAEAKEPTPMGQPDNDNDEDDQLPVVADSPWFPNGDPRNDNEGVVPKDPIGLPPADSIMPWPKSSGMSDTGPAPGLTLADLLRQLLGGNTLPQEFVPGTDPAVMLTGKPIQQSTKPAVLPDLPPGLNVGPTAFSRPFPSGWQKSDLRLKSNIARVGTHPRGVGIYEYDIDGRRERGVIAQELLTVLPEAVRLGDDGFFRVNYAAL